MATRDAIAQALIDSYGEDYGYGNDMGLYDIEVYAPQMADAVLAVLSDAESEYEQVGWLNDLGSFGPYDMGRNSVPVFVRAERVVTRGGTPPSEYAQIPGNPPLRSRIVRLPPPPDDGADHIPPKETG